MSSPLLEKKRLRFVKRWISKRAWRWKFLNTSGFRWKRINWNWKLSSSFIDDVLFKIISVFEAIVLGSTLCFFFLCCGCHL